MLSFSNFGDVAFSVQTVIHTCTRTRIHTFYIQPYIHGHTYILGATIYTWYIQKLSYTHALARVYDLRTGILRAYIHSTCIHTYIHGHTYILGAYIHTWAYIHTRCIHAYMGIHTF